MSIFIMSVEYFENMYWWWHE